MLFFLIVGVLLGAVAMIFVIQNVASVSVHFFSFQMDGSLATILFLALLVGMMIEALVVLPSFMTTHWRVKKLQKQNKVLEEEASNLKDRLASIAVRPLDTTVVETVEVR